MYGIDINDDVNHFPYRDNEEINGGKSSQEFRRHFFTIEASQINIAFPPISYNLGQEIELLEQLKEITNGPPGFKTIGPIQNIDGLVIKEVPSGREVIRLSNKPKKMGKEIMSKSQQKKRGKKNPQTSKVSRTLAQMTSVALKSPDS